MRYNSVGWSTLRPRDVTVSRIGLNRNHLPIIKMYLAGARCTVECANSITPYMFCQEILNRTAVDCNAADGVYNPQLGGKPIGFYAPDWVVW